ncbi:MAG TPA: lysophospholipid acyltransferase family protein [Candidatus Polarisedimenticolia bacterium]|jgi:1-acyl-sn-glycerol-3-phosphate acyltransferase
MRRLKVAFYWTIKTIAWPVTRAYVRLRVIGGGNVPATGPCLLVANHVSFVDPVVLGSAFPRRIIFMITRPIYRLRRLTWFYYMMDTIPVAFDVPDPGAMKAALRALRAGRVVGIFPEGQRMPDGNLGQGKSGAAMIAARSGAPVIPAAIIGAHGVMPVGSAFPRPRQVRVVFGEPFRFLPYEGRRPPREQMDAFADRIMQSIADLMTPEEAAMDAPAGTRRRSSG